MSPVDAIKHIIKEGKSPSLALLKSKTRNQYPLPLLIQALSQYQSGQLNLEEEPDLEPQRQALSEQEKIVRLEEQVQQLTRRIETLESKLNMTN